MPRQHLSTFDRDERAILPMTHLEALMVVVVWKSSTPVTRADIAHALGKPVSRVNWEAANRLTRAGWLVEDRQPTATGTERVVYRRPDALAS